MTAARNALLGLLSLAGAALGLSACAGYETYPDVPTNNFSMSDPNTTSMPPCMAAALQWVVMKYPPGGQAPEELAMGDAQPRPFTINLPPASTWKTCKRVADDVGMGCRPLTADSTELPVLHVTYVRVRGDEAVVNIIRPVSSLGTTPGGEPVPQEIKVQLRGGINPWHVIAWREWQVGTAEIPELHIVTRPPEEKLLPSKRFDAPYLARQPVMPKVGEPATAKVPE